MKIEKQDVIPLMLAIEVALEKAHQVLSETPIQSDNWVSTFRHIQNLERIRKNLNIEYYGLDLFNKIKQEA